MLQFNTPHSHFNSSLVRVCISVILWGVLFSGCVTTKQYDEDMALLKVGMNSKYAEYLIAFDKHLIPTEEQVELNRFLIEALYGQLYELETETKIYYIVKEGDSLWKISEYLKEINSLDNPDLIYPEQLIKIKE